MKTAHWIYSHYALNTYKAKCSSCGYEEKICDDLERKSCPKCNAIMNAPYQKDGTNRKNCEYRHENGNCLKVGGFCMSVDDEHCVKGGKE